MLTIPEVAGVCRISEKTIRREIERGHLHPTVVGLRKIRFTTGEVTRYISSRTPSPDGPDEQNANAERIIQEVQRICQAEIPAGGE